MDHDLSDYIQDRFTSDEFDDIISLDSSIFPVNNQPHGHVLSHYLAQGQNDTMADTSFCSGSSSSSDGTDYKTGESHYDPWRQRLALNA